MTIEPPRRSLWDKIIESPGITVPVLAALCWGAIWLLYKAAEAVINAILGGKP